ncbi:hypothetical protein QYM36_008422 [Artemia franciscana]|uniref:Reverse transcriptase domain-containing protein n=1 Tax=Artemia franciscana TaxID=6661 RepID=A0AA88IFW6_ARTSF|nr:hypothetical protein QYM36_008422 [Artemia franciscana]
MMNRGGAPETHFLISSNILFIKDYCSDEDSEEFYSQLQSLTDFIPKEDIITVIGDFNAVVGLNSDGNEDVIVTFGHGTRNRRRENLTISPLEPSPPPLRIECEAALKSLKSNKSPGPDGLHAKLLKVDEEVVTDLYHKIATAAWHKKYFPKTFLSHVEATNGEMIGGIVMDKLTYTDDIDMLTGSVAELQTKAENLEVVTGTFGMKINKDKTKAMRVSRFNNPSPPKIKLNGAEIEWVDNFT